MDTMTESPLARLSEEQLEELGKAFDAIHDDVFEDLGDRDRRYITNLISVHRRMLVASRVLLCASRFRPAWLVGMSGLSLAKILENMEIGHNVMHGQWDWMNDPQINSSTWDWDSASTAEAWKHSHNYVHHTYTNIRGKDRDLGYEIMRIDIHQKWHPIYLLQPFYNLVLAALFEWGVATHDLDFDAIKAGDKSKAQLKRELKGMAVKGRTQIVKDYIAFPLLSAGAAAVAAAIRTARADTEPGAQPRVRRGLKRVRPRAQHRSPRAEILSAALGAGRVGFRATLRADLAANLVRNVWSYSIIFCGHFPDQTYSFAPEEVEDETRGGFYVRQLLGAANIEGSPLFHVMSGNLGYQVEHHLYPDMPSTRYAEIAPRVKEICKRYGLPYNTGPFGSQLASVQRTILRLAFPGGKPRPRPGPYRGHNADTGPSIPTHGSASNGSPTKLTGPHGSGPEQPTPGVRVSMPDND
jgi:NADPH-dependent stearoyl-CoA 9-desaturase